MEIKELYKKYTELEGKEIKVCGWVRTIRSSKVFGFIELNDGSFFKGVQIVFEEGVLSNFKEISKLRVGSSLVISGILVM